MALFLERLSEKKAGVFMTIKIVIKLVCMLGATSESLQILTNLSFTAAP